LNSSRAASSGEFKFKCNRFTFHVLPFTKTLLLKLKNNSFSNKIVKRFYKTPAPLKAGRDIV
jgi:hypothetical protein